MISKEVYDIIRENAEIIDKEINHNLDYDFDFFGFKTLEKSYLYKVGNKPQERPQHLLMRVSLGIHKKNLEKAFQTYHYMSQRWFIHATPTLFNSGYLEYFVLLKFIRYNTTSNVFMFPLVN